MLSTSISSQSCPESIGPYRLIKILGTGSFAKVYLACRQQAASIHEHHDHPERHQQQSDSQQNSTSYPTPTATKNTLVALKTVHKSHPNAQTLINVLEQEAQILKSIKNEHIASFVEWIDTADERKEEDRDGYVAIAMEYVSGGELYDYVLNYPAKAGSVGLPETEACRLFKQLATAVGYLHDRNIAHRDLKLENILRDSSHHLRLVDFGLARKIDPIFPYTTIKCGSEPYLAPEIIRGKPYDPRKTDVWALGVILFAFLTGRLPFELGPFLATLEDNNDNDRNAARGGVGTAARSWMLRNIVTGNWAFTGVEEDEISETARDLVMRILNVDPEQRVSVEDILKHPWLSPADIHCRPAEILDDTEVQTTTFFSYSSETKNNVPDTTDCVAENQDSSERQEAQDKPKDRRKKNANRISLTSLTSPLPPIKSPRLATSTSPRSSKPATHSWSLPSSSPSLSNSSSPFSLHTTTTASSASSFSSSSEPSPSSPSSHGAVPNIPYIAPLDHDPSNSLSNSSPPASPLPPNSSPTSNPTPPPPPSITTTPKFTSKPFLTPPTIQIPHPTADSGGRKTPGLQISLNLSPHLSDLALLNLELLPRLDGGAGGAVDEGIVPRSPRTDSGCGSFG